MALLAGAALWTWVAYALWHSTTLPALDLRHLDAGHYFGPAFLHRSATFERFLAIDRLLGEIVLVVVLVVYARRGKRLIGESAAGRIGTGMLLAMLGFAFVWLAEVPFGLAGLWWERRYGISHLGYVPWVFNSFIGLGSVFVFVCVAFGIAMGLAGSMRRWWWAVAAPAFVAIGLLYTFVSPYLIVNSSAAHDPRLATEARELERVEGVGHARLEVKEVHGFTIAPNAESTGFGPTSTVILWDTLLGDGFNRAEVRAVLAHEVAHLAHDDALKRAGWLALFLLPTMGLVAFFTRRRGGLARPEAVPVALLVLVLAQVVAAPLLNVAYRRQEAAADWAALDATHEPGAARALKRQLAVKSLADPEPPGWAYALFADHPSIMQRIAMTYAWEAR